MKRSEYEVQAPAFRALLLAEAEKPAATQLFPDFEDWLTLPGTSTCTTPPSDCPVSGQPFPVTLHENADGVFRGQCGQCGNSITPVPTFEDD